MWVTMQAMHIMQANVQAMKNEEINIILTINKHHSQASEQARFLNPRIWLANHAHVTGPAFYDTALKPDFFPAQRCT